MYAQDAPSGKTSSARKIHHSGYGALTTNYSKFNGDDALFVGAYRGWMINHKLMLGLAGHYLVTQHDGYGFNPQTNKMNELKMGYGGLMVEYTFFESKVVHGTDLHEQIQRAVNHLTASTEKKIYKERFMVHSGKSFLVVHHANVAYFIKDTLIYLVTNDKQQFLTDFQMMEELEDLLDPKLFYRANRQYIISAQSADSFRTDIYSKMIPQLKNPLNLSIDISREKAQAFKNWIQ